MVKRLQKVIAQAGVVSRRKAEKAVSAGQVTVNGKKIAELGAKIEPSDKIEVNGVPAGKGTLHTYLSYKPRDVISSAKDDKGRKTVVDFFEDVPCRLYPVGRLNYDTSSLLLMTNDGELANKLMHPRNEVPKVYVARIKGLLSPEDIRSLTREVRTDGHKSTPTELKTLKTDEKESTQIVQLTIHEGHYHRVKRMFGTVHHFVEELSREKYAFLTLKSLTSDEYYELMHKKVFWLNHLVD